MLHDDIHLDISDTNEVLARDVPFIHPKINVKNMSEDGRFFLSDREVFEICSHMRAQTSNRDIYKTPNYDIVQMQGSYYITNNINPLGQGAFGKVVLAQNVQTKEMFALKISKTPTQQKAGIAKKEAKLLERIDRTQGQLDTNTSHRVMMKLAPGNELYDLSTSQRDLPTVDWLQAALSTLEAFDVIHANGLIHRDIKGENILFDLCSGKATAIDVGLAAEANVKKGITGKGICGTSGFIAPESVLTGTYSEKSDVYSLGKTIGDLLGMTFRFDTKYLRDKVDIYSNRIMIINEDSFAFELATRIPNLTLRSEILDYLHKMTDTDPANRPTLDEAKVFFKVLISNQLPFAAKIKNVGVLDVNEYHNAPETDKKAMLKAMLTLDQIYLIDSAVPNHNDRVYMMVQRELTRHNVIVGDKMFIDPSVENTLQQIPNQMNKHDNGAIYTYFHVTKDKNLERIKALESSHIQTMLVDDQKRMMDYKKQIFTHQVKAPLATNHLTKVLDGLNEELSRLVQKYGKDGDKPIFKNEKVKKRYLEIMNGREDIKRHPSLSYATLNEKLDALQNKMVSTGLFTSLASFIGIDAKSSGGKNVSKLKNDISTEVTQEFSRFRPR